MIFDQNMLDEALHEFEIDTSKMPLGKISRKHILNAYQVLTDLQTAMDSASLGRMQLMDFSNRFYTLIPQDFGLSAPPIISNREMIATKTQMLDNLLEIEIAYNIIKMENDEIDAGNRLDPIDLHYEKLNCLMEILDKNTNEFNIISTYVANTHAPTHDLRLEIIDIIKLNKDTETQNFRADIQNRQFLWHGSRMSNMAGILSQGLKIAPPEAPVSGYMFGKGIYTADMVSKSANYCNAIETEGFLLLCEVALGEMQLLTDAKNIKKPPKGKHSVKGLGQTYPDPKQEEKIDDIVVPCGKPVTSKSAGLTLLYNEYIVYDENQIRLRYLVRAKFHSKGGALL